MSENVPNASSGDRPAPYSEDNLIIQDLAPLLLKSAYACGGSVLVKERTEAKDEGVTSPVTLRLDAAQQVKKPIFPQPNTAAVQALVMSTQPASFGRDGKNVVDESNRNASKLDPTAFSTDFCPYAAGTIDTIEQALLPLPNNSSQGIRAELYKMNVTSGHRITLTYKLFIRRGLGETVGSSSTLNVVQLPVYKEMSAALANPVLFSKGESLTKYCSHAYAHATQEGIRALPAVLKGSDMVTYEVFNSLGVRIDVRPTLDLSQKREWGWVDEYDQDEYFEHDYVGKELAETVLSELSPSRSIEENLEQFPHDRLKVKWLNQPVVNTENI